MIAIGAFRYLNSDKGGYEDVLLYFWVGNGFMLFTAGLFNLIWYYTMGDYWWPIRADIKDCDPSVEDCPEPVEEPSYDYGSEDTSEPAEDTSSDPYAYSYSYY